MTIKKNKIKIKSLQRVTLGEHRGVEISATWLINPLEFKEIKPLNPKGHQPCIFIRRTDAETEAPILWPSDVKCQLIGKDPETGNIESKKKRG